MQDTPTHSGSKVLTRLQQIAALVKRLRQASRYLSICIRTSRALVVGLLSVFQNKMRRNMEVVLISFETRTVFTYTVCSYSCMQPSTELGWSFHRVLLKGSAKGKNRWTLKAAAHRLQPPESAAFPQVPNTSTGVSSLGCILFARRVSLWYFVFSFFLPSHWSIFSLHSLLHLPVGQLKKSLRPGPSQLWGCHAWVQTPGPVQWTQSSPVMTQLRICEM